MFSYNLKSVIVNGWRRSGVVIACYLFYFTEYFNLLFIIFAYNVYAEQTLVYVSIIDIPL